MGLGCLIGLPCHVDDKGSPYFSGGARFSMCMQSLAPPMNYSTSTYPVFGKRIDEARNEIAEQALRQNAEHVLFLDTDVLFPPQSFMQLLSRHKNNPEHKLISGVYWSKSNPTFPLIFEEAGRGSKLDWKLGDYIEAKYATGMGLILIHTDVFKAIEPPWFAINYGLNVDPETGSSTTASLTEDLLFCEKVTAAGFKIMVDTGLQAGHLDSNTGIVFGLNDSMPQAQGRAPEEWETLYIGDLMAGGEPAHVLSENPRVQPTWVGPPDKVPTSKRYNRVCVKDADVKREAMPEVAKEWARVVGDGGTLEILHPDFQERLATNAPIEHRNVYSPDVVEAALNGAGLVELKREKDKSYFMITAKKPARTTPLVSIIIVAHDLHEMTLQCIESVRHSEHRDFDFEIVLVDNGSEKKYPPMGDRLFRYEKNQPFGRAVTKGVKEANPESVYLVFLNNDTVCHDPKWLANLLTRIRGQGRIAAIGPKQITPVGTIYHTEIGFTPDRVPFHLFAGFAHDHVNVQMEKDVLALNFGCVLLRREAFEKYPLDKRYGSIGNYEDIDWCLTVRKEGGALVYTPSAEIIHFGAQTQAQMPEVSDRAIKANRKKFVEKWAGEKATLFGLEEGDNGIRADEGG